MAQESSGVIDLVVLDDAAVAEADGESVASLSTNTPQKRQPRADSLHISDDHEKIRRNPLQIIM